MKNHSDWIVENEIDLRQINDILNPCQNVAVAIEIERCGYFEIRFVGLVFVFELVTSNVCYERSKVMSMTRIPDVSGMSLWGKEHLRRPTVEWNK